MIKNIPKIVDEIKKGNLVVTATDTVYGILADAMNQDAIKKLYKAKNRKEKKPFLLLVSDKKMLKEYTSNITPLEEELINRYFPGKLTIIFTKNKKVNNLVSAGSNFIGIRLPDNKELREVINRVGNPLVSTSANIASQQTITNINQIPEQLKVKISYIEDSGTIEEYASTIIKVENEKIKIIREGKMISEIIKDYNL